jgi:hypothetical protein
MTIRKTSDGAAVVDTCLSWLPVDAYTPPDGNRAACIIIVKVTV